MREPKVGDRVKIVDKPISELDFIKYNIFQVDKLDKKFLGKEVIVVREEYDRYNRKPLYGVVREESWDDVEEYIYFPEIEYIITDILPEELFQL